MNKISCLIIDDEFLNRKLINLMVTKINAAFEICGEAENIRDGYSMINSLKPQVVFLDIKMPDGSGFDLLKQFSVVDFEVVFITGFDQYVLQAFEFNALDYVLKPIDMDKFKLTLDKLEQRVKTNDKNSGKLEKVIESYSSQNGLITKVPVLQHDGTILLNIDEIMYIQAFEQTTVFTKFPSGKYVSSKQLPDFEFILDSFRHYVHINDTTYINANYLISCSKGSECVVTMRDKTTLKVEGRKREIIMALLSKKSP
jgi:two-component system LytT family response regulator